MISNTEIVAWTIVAGALANVSCALVGCYLVLRRMSLLGDAISHAVLPGLVGAYLLTGKLSSLPMFIGAMLLGVLTAFLTELLHRHGKVPEDASMGAVFTSLFALGVLMLSAYASRAHIDPGCVLYGLIEFIPLDAQVIAGVRIPRAIITLTVALIATLLFLTLFWKELKIASFDPMLATAMGFSASTVHYALMGMTAGVTVASFEAVGSILVIAMLIVPAATAHLLTDRLGYLLLLSTLVAIVSSIAGFFLAAATNTSVAAMMAVVAGGQFALAVVFAPRHGLLGHLLSNRALQRRIADEDLLALLYRVEELAAAGHGPLKIQAAAALVALQGQMPDSVKAVAAPPRRLSRLLGERALVRLRREGRLRQLPDTTLELTESGREQASSIVRSHRLWEAYLVEHFQLPLDHIHAPAERIEHFIGPQLQAELAAELQRPGQDPHGREIPPG